MNRIVVIGASAGGIEALQQLVRGLPDHFPAPICVVMHTGPQGPGVLSGILSRISAIPVSQAIDRARLKAGHVYIAPPDLHVLIEPGLIRLTRGPKENRFRPAIDPLFRSAAQVFGPGAIGVILTGNLDDGTSGLDVIKRLGGTAIVQDPIDALFPSMPRSAIDRVAVDYVVPLADLVPLLVELTRPDAVESLHRQVPDNVDVEVKIAKEHDPIEVGLESFGNPTRFACPECHGVLLELKDDGQRRCCLAHSQRTRSTNIAR